MSRVVFFALLGVFLALNASAQLGQTAPALLNSNGSNDIRDSERPQLATDGLGNWVAIWDSNENLNGTSGSDLDILVSRSTNNGLTWTAPALLNTNGTSDSGDDIRPTLAVGNGMWIAVWNTNSRIGQTGTADNDIAYSRSTNNGLTWSAPAYLNTNATSDSGDDAIPRIATDGQGNWVCAWESNSNILGKGSDYDILVSRSSDNGATWTAPALLNNYGTVDDGIDQRLELVTDGAGTWVCAWATNSNINWVSGWDWDIGVSRSTNNGATWSTAVALPADGTTDFRDDYRPGLATDNQGNWVAAWSSGTTSTSDIYFSRSSNNAVTWSNAARINPTNSTASGINEFPRITTDRLGNWIAVWDSTSQIGGGVGSDYDVLYARSSNNGQTWTAPAALNTDAGSESGFDLVPQLATDRLGNWVAVWEFTNRFGSDFDIAVSRFTLAPPGLSVTSILPATTGPTNATSVNFTVTFSANAVNFNNASDVVITHSGTANSGVTISGGPQAYTVGVTGITGSGSFTLRASTTSDIQSETAQPLTSSVTSAAVVIDNNPPTVAMSSGAAATTGTSPIPVSVLFSEPVSGFTSGDITPGNATVGGFAGSGASYSFNLTPLVSGTVTADIAASVATDAAGNPNTAAAQFSRVYNPSQPTITLSSLAGDPVTGAITVSASLSESSTNFASGDVTPANATVSNFTGSGTSYSFTLTPIASGLFSASVAAGTFTNSIGNPNAASNTLSRTADLVPPGVTLSSGAGDPVNGAIAVSVTLTESSANFDSTDITTVNSAISNFTGTGASYSFTLTPNGNGTFSASVAAGTFTDTAGNSNTASNTLSRTADLSSGGSVTPGPSAVLNSWFSGDSGDDERPQIATDRNGNWVAVWDSTNNANGSGTGDLDIFVSRSSDNGATWSTPVPLNTNAAGDAGSDLRPAIDTNGSGAWVCVWYSNSPGVTGGDYDILVARSTDNGATWTAPAVLNTNGSSDSGDDEIPRIATDRSGNWICIWDSNENLNGKGTDYDVLLARSTDNGATWTAPALLNSNGTIDGADDIRTEIATDGNGVWVALWAANAPLNGINFDYDILVSRSTDNGVTWSPVAKVDAAMDTDSGEDFRPALATDGAGNWVAAWHTNDTRGGTIGPDQEIIVNRSSDGGVTWSPSAVLNTNFSSESGDDEFVRLSTDNAGNWIAMWDSNANVNGSGGDYDILISRSTNNGLTWSDPIAFNSNAVGDSGIDSVPQVDTDRQGNWVAVWESNGGLDGNGDADYDTVFGRFTIPLGTGFQATSVVPSTTGPTTATTVNFTVTFNQAAVNFNNASDVVITHTGTANTGVTITGGPTVYNVAVTGISGTGSFTLRASTTSDVQNTGGSPLASSVTSAAVTIDNTVPTATLSSAAAATVDGPISVSATLSESSANFAAADITTVNASVSGFSGFGTGYTFTLTPLAAGTFSATVPANSFTDAAGNNNPASNTLSRTAAFAGPTISLTSAAPATVIGPISVTATLSAASTNFAAGDVTPTNATVSNFAGSGTSYTFTLTPLTSGTFSANVAAGTFTDASASPNQASNTLSRTADLTRPTATLSSVAGDPVNGAIAVTVVLTEASTTFTSGDVTRVNCSISNFAGSGANYSFTLTPSASGVFSAIVNAGAFTDAAGNTNTASNTLSRTADLTRPTMTLTSASAGTVIGPILVTATSSEATTNFAATDITVVNATVSDFAGTGASYSFTLTPIASGTFSASVPAGRFTDAAGNTNTASNTLSRTADLTAPTVTLSSSAGSLVRAGISVSGALSEASSDFVAADVATYNATVSNFTRSNNRRNYTFTLTPLADGIFIALVPAAAFTDAAGNFNTQSNAISRTADITRPSVTMSSVAANPTNVSPIAVTVTFSEPVTGFTSSDISRTNASISGFTGSGANYSFNLTPTAPGTVTADIAAGRCSDAAGNTNTAAPTFSRIYAP